MDAMTERKLFLQKLDITEDSLIGKAILEGCPVCTYGAFGGYFVAPLNENQKREIKKLERKGTMKVFYVIGQTISVGGKQMGHEIYLYQELNDNQENHLDIWEIDKNIFGMMAYVRNITYPMFSEYGSIGIQKNSDGLLIRTM